MTSKEKILRTAYTMIHQNGFERTSVDEIIRKAGVSKSNFYYHFRTKQMLGLAVLDMRIENYTAEILGKTLLDENLSPLKRLASFYEKVISLHVDYECRYGCPFGNLAIELSAKNNRFRKRLEEFFGFWQQTIESCLSEGVKIGEFSDKINVQVFSELILSHLQGAILMTKTYKRINPLERGSKEIINLLKAA
ncbi:MAG: TetR family transcriptional regulator [Candidatus Dadabacteria bacterium]|nr:TetR family transcriptional regulator [Candidatus Dadabacteria bacterium]NIQ16107.1 TetR family transcriptional regulator [Candidatus Dadabacteria bacterium]